MRARVPVIAAVALASFGWGLLPIDAPQGVNPLNWPPAYASWFAAGMLLAEWTVSPLGWAHKLARNRWAITGIALTAYLISASPLAGPKDLVPATLGQFVVRTSMGAVVAWALLAPLVLDRPDTAPALRAHARAQRHQVGPDALHDTLGRVLRLRRHGVDAAIDHVGHGAELGDLRAGRGVDAADADVHAGVDRIADGVRQAHQARGDRAAAEPDLAQHALTEAALRRGVGGRALAAHPGRDGARLLLGRRVAGDLHDADAVDVPEGGDPVEVTITVDNTTGAPATLTPSLTGTGAQPLEADDVSVSPATFDAPVGTSTQVLRFVPNGDGVYETDETGEIGFGAAVAGCPLWIFSFR